MRRCFPVLLPLLPFVLVLALIPLAGCGGGGTPAPSPSSSPTPTTALAQYTVSDVTPNAVVSKEQQVEVNAVSATGKIVCRVNPTGAQNASSLYSYDINNHTFDKVYYYDASTDTTLQDGYFPAVSSGGLSVGRIGPSGADYSDTAPVFVYDTATKQISLPPNPLDFARPSGINDSGDILNNDTKGGIFFIEGSVFKKNGDGTYTKSVLPLPNGTDSNYAKFINNAGTVYATAGRQDNSSISVPFLWQNGVTTPLALPDSTDVTQLTESGLLAGTRLGIKDRYVPFLWRNEASVEFTLPNESICFYTLANNQGDVLALLGTDLYLWKHDAYTTPLKLQSLLPSTVALQNAFPLYFFDDGRILLHKYNSPNTWLLLLSPR